MRCCILDILNACYLNPSCYACCSVMVHIVLCKASHSNFSYQTFKAVFCNTQICECGKNVCWTCPETGCEGSMVRCQDHVGSFNPHPWWQLLGTDGMLHYQALFLSHFPWMILAPVNQRLQNHSGNFPPDLTLLFTLWVRQSSSLSPVPIICK